MLNELEVFVVGLEDYGPVYYDLRDQVLFVVGLEDYGPVYYDLRDQVPRDQLPCVVIF